MSNLIAYNDYVSLLCVDLRLSSSDAGTVARDTNNHSLYFYRVNASSRNVVNAATMVIRHKASTQ